MNKNKFKYLNIKFIFHKDKLFCFGNKIYMKICLDYSKMLKKAALRIQCHALAKNNRFLRIAKGRCVVRIEPNVYQILRVTTYEYFNR